MKEKMSVRFVSNRLTWHQVPLSDALFELSQDYRFIAAEEIPEDRKEAYPPCDDYAYFRQGAAADELNTDVVIIGSAPDKLIAPRLKAKKLTFKYSERLYKDGLTVRNYWHAMAGAWLHHGRFQKHPLYLLCASAFTSADCAKFGLYKNRAYKWGYFPEMKTYDPEELLQKKTPSTILWCGRLLEWKHPDDAITVAAALKKAGYSFRLEIIGDGEMGNKIADMIAENDLADCVTMPGAKPTNEVRSHMESAGIYLFTSDRKEGWGAVLNEAMNSGCAVVASHAIGAVPYMIKDGENGYVYHSGNVEELCRKVMYLLDHPSEQQRLGRAAYDTIAGEWNAEVAARRVIELSEHILAGEKSPDLFQSGPCSKAEIIKDDWY